MKIVAKQLKDVPETLLFTLYMRYRESQRPDGKLSDKRYAALIDAIDYDFSVFADIPDGMQLSIVCRTIIFDHVTKQHIEKHPEATIVSLGSGLDFRVDRVDNGKILWVDIDVPEVIEIRKHLFQETKRLRFIPASVLDFAWMDHIPKYGPVLFIAEGLLVYFTPHEVKTILIQIANHFPPSEMVLDVISNLYLNMVKTGTPYAFLHKMFALWKWGLDDWSELEAMDPRIRFIEEFYQRDGFGERMPEDLKDALSDSSYSEYIQEEIQKFSRIVHITLG